MTLSCWVELAEPVVISSVSMNDNNPVRLRNGKPSVSPWGTTMQPHVHCRNTPSRIPLRSRDISIITDRYRHVTHCSRMEIAHGEANLLVGNKSSRRSEHLDRKLNELALAVLGRVLTLMPGGLNGYSAGNMIIPWYSPPAYGLSGGPLCVNAIELTAEVLPDIHTTR